MKITRRQLKQIVEAWDADEHAMRHPHRQRVNDFGRPTISEEKLDMVMVDLIWESLLKAVPPDLRDDPDITEQIEMMSHRIIDGELYQNFLSEIRQAIRNHWGDYLEHEIAGA